MHINRCASFDSRSIKLHRFFSGPSASPWSLLTCCLGATIRQLHLSEQAKKSMLHHSTAAPLLPIFRSCQHIIEHLSLSWQKLLLVGLCSERVRCIPVQDMPSSALCLWGHGFREMEYSQPEGIPERQHLETKEQVTQAQYSLFQNWCLYKTHLLRSHKITYKEITARSEKMRHF